MKEIIDALTQNQGELWYTITVFIMLFGLMVTIVSGILSLKTMMYGIFLVCVAGMSFIGWNIWFDITNYGKYYFSGLNNVMLVATATLIITVFVIWFSVRRIK